MGSQADAIHLNDTGHEAIVSAMAGTRKADAGVRQALMRALEAAETAGAERPRWHAERVIALVNLELYALLVSEGSASAYQKAIQDALDATGAAFDGTPSTPLEVNRLAHVWYSLGFHQQALGGYQPAISLYQRAAQTGMKVPEPDRDIRLLVLVATNIATCAERLGLGDLAARTRAHVQTLLKLLGG